jgi:glycogen debranching enzyme
MFSIVKDDVNSKLWSKRYAEKKEIVNSLYWNADDGTYYDIDRNTHKHYKVLTTASYWALTAGIASDEQARALAEKVEDPSLLGGNVPLLSLSRSDADFDPDGLYWRGSLWMPTAYASLCGLIRYGLHSVAHDAGVKILDHMYSTYKNYEPHTIWECYSPTKCEPASNEHGNCTARPDFCGWSALGPISVFIECVLGFHTIDGFKRRVEWQKPDDVGENIGIRNLRFGNVTTDIVASKNICTVISDAPYTLSINGIEYAISEGENKFPIK